MYIYCTAIYVTIVRLRFYLYAYYCNTVGYKYTWRCGGLVVSVPAYAWTAHLGFGFRPGGASPPRGLRGGSSH